MKGMTQPDIARMDARRSIRWRVSEHQMESIRASDGEYQSIRWRVSEHQMESIRASEESTRASDRGHQGIRLTASD
jgi:hypothetical protein